MWLRRIFGSGKPVASEAVRMLLTASGSLRDASEPIPVSLLDYGTGRPPRIPLHFKARATMVEGRCYEKGEDNISPPDRY